MQVQGFKAHRLLYHSTLGLRVIKNKKVRGLGVGVCLCVAARWLDRSRSWTVSLSQTLSLSLSFSLSLSLSLSLCQGVGVGGCRWVAALAREVQVLHRLWFPSIPLKGWMDGWMEAGGRAPRGCGALAREVQVLDRRKRRRQQRCQLCFGRVGGLRVKGLRF